MTKKTSPDELATQPTENDTQLNVIVPVAPGANKPVAKATHHVTGRAQMMGLEHLQENELRSIYSLFAWVANEQNSSAETIQSITEARFGIDHVTKLKKRDYDEVIKFLVDLRIDEMKH